MNALTIVILAFSLLGALDWIIGNRFGLGAEFERGFHLFGAMALSMMGMIIIAPALGVWLSPVFDGFYAIFKIDPSVIPAMLFANDMGGASLASEINKSQAIGGYNAFVISSMMGCVISFTIPFASGIVDKAQHGDMFLGFLAGIVTIPVGSIVAGFISGLGFIAIILNLLPMLILSALIVLGLIYLPDTSVRIFQGFGFVIKVLIIVGLGLGIFTFLTHITVYSELEELESAALICVPLGCFPIHVRCGQAFASADVSAREAYRNQLYLRPRSYSHPRHKRYRLRHDARYGQTRRCYKFGVCSFRGICFRQPSCIHHGLRPLIRSPRHNRQAYLGNISSYTRPVYTQEKSKNSRKYTVKDNLCLQKVKFYHNSRP